MRPEATYRVKKRRITTADIFLITFDASSNLLDKYVGKVTASSFSVYALNRGATISQIGLLQDWFYLNPGRLKIK